MLLSLAIAAALSACAKPETPAPAASSQTAAPPAAAPTLKLDESKLLQPVRFAVGDLDPSKNVCDNLGQYVNGKWFAANAIPGDRSSWGVSDVLAERSLAVQHQLAEQAGQDAHATGIEKIVGDLWATGMDEAKINAQGIEPLKNDLSAIAALDTPEKIAAYLRTSAAEGRGVIFDFGGEADFKNSSMNIAYATQSGLGLPDKGYYFDQDKRDKLTAYQQHIAKVLELSGTAAADAAAQAKAVIAFETRLAKASLSREQLQGDVGLYYQPISPAKANELTPNFSWTEFFKSQGVEIPAQFSLAMPDFHKEVSKMLADTPAADWQAYLRYHTVDGASPYLSDPFVAEHFEFHSKAMVGQKEQKARWKRVLNAINGSAGEAMGQLYVKVAFPQQSKAQMDALVQGLRTALKARIENLTWMSAETKKKALEKWASFTPKIGYPDKWRDWSGLKTGRDSYYANALAAEQFNYQWNLGKIGKPVDKTEWGMSPQTVNAYYNPLQNEVVFPAAILQPPFFDPNADEAMNYGGIGAVIGHEMTHGYDDQGSRFDPSGNMVNWWTPEDAKGFAARSTKLIEQFNGYEAAPGLHVNGKLTLGENIADLGGLATAYDAMRLAVGDKPDPKTDGLTRDQRFFYSFATSWRDRYTPDLLKVIVNSNEHAPADFRAIGAPSNLPAFAAAFSCKAGQPMVRAADKQVVIW
ncbi:MULTISPECIES: M13-type metalloendopeptidase [unclassified Lysobacter]|uniref:M13 family metallopeptidase n=1 Tax=unclassified Lysobacter TaxID=2635362 RepID=UPI001BEC04BA|nr:MULTISPECIES: M13-type metalloendopeptidase [unclassified Lysobacter]MBT2745179.1 peptidase [Lysobacter sp. ISL-42]MBT2751348.1 peptidase [Lysobacter sp. ISL-50]MBT2777290.1 peptidase [Lysobacter sp. ISL-54]MBT2781634.1 peptidase [Lysobacter sp. ISL-52]